MIKFIHTADIHFGMENYGKIDPISGIHTRLLDFQKALNFCIDIAIKENIDFFLFSGDAYKTANPSPTQQQLLMSCFIRLYKANIPVIIIIGNHDHPLSFGKANALDVFANLPIDGFHVISKPDTLNLQTKNGPVQIVGIPWPTRNNIILSNKHLLKSAAEITEYLTQAVGSIIQQISQTLDPNIPAILAGHLTVSSGIFSGSEKRAIYGTDSVFLPSQLAIPPFDYVALGHLHRYQNLNPNGYPALVYSGSIERIDFGERKEEKGFCLVQIPEKNKAHHEFIPVPTRKFIQIEVKLTNQIDQTQELLEVIFKHDIKDAVLKILYHVPSGKKDQINIITVQRALFEAHYIVGIIPIREIETRERRNNLKISMDLPTLLDMYFESKTQLKENKKELIEKTLILQAELEERETQKQE